MDPFEHLPDKKIINRGAFSEKFLNLGISSFKEACMYVHNLEYGYNSDYSDNMILFKENKGSCTMKHGTIAKLAEELKIPLHKNIGVYKFSEQITTGAEKITKKYNIPYVPMVHCFLKHRDLRFDLTEGNKNGKNKPINKFIKTKQVKPLISRKEEYTLFRDILKNEVLPRSEMEGVKIRILLKAREEAIKLLKRAIE